METGVIVSLAAYFIAMLGIGLWAWKKSTDDIDGYLLGGRQLSPAVAALSAGASDMSGWLLLGLPGAAFVAGLSATWIAIGCSSAPSPTTSSSRRACGSIPNAPAMPSPSRNFSRSASTIAAMRCG